MLPLLFKRHVVTVPMLSKHIPQPAIELKIIFRICYFIKSLNM